MKKFALLALLAAALAIPSVAAADPAQGSLTGVGLLRNGGTNFELGATVIDGGTSYVGKENDRSGNCSGDIGSVLINEAVSFNVVCAHFVASSRCCNAGSPKMRFAYGSGPSYNVIKVVDNGIPNPAGQSPDLVSFGIVNSLAEAQSWVNLGAIGSGNPSGWMSLTLLPDPISFNSDYQVHA